MIHHIVKSHTIEYFNQIINGLLEDGFRLRGQAVIFQDGNGFVYFQQMIKD